MAQSNSLEADRILTAAEIGYMVGALQQRRAPRNGTEPKVSDSEAAARVGRDLIRKGEISGFESRGRYCAKLAEVNIYLASRERQMRQ